MVNFEYWFKIVEQGGKCKNIYEFHTVILENLDFSLMLSFLLSDFDIQNDNDNEDAPGLFRGQNDLLYQFYMFILASSGFKIKASNWNSLLFWTRKIDVAYNLTH